MKNNTKYFIDKKRDELIEIDKEYLNRYEYIAHVLTVIDMNKLLYIEDHARSFINGINIEENDVGNGLTFNNIEIHNNIHFKNINSKNNAYKNFNTDFYINFFIDRMDKVKTQNFKLKFNFYNSIYKEYFNKITNNLLNEDNLVNEGVNKEIRSLMNFELFKKELYNTKYNNSEYLNLFENSSYMKDNVIGFINKFEGLFSSVIYQNNLSVLMTLYEIKYMYEDDIDFYINFYNENYGLVNILELIESDENDLFKEIKTEKEMKAFKVRKGFK
ncbi:hypothetical protein UFVDC4_00038 [Staphylococcus phage vB_SauM-UFV_DC4]|nr:hypothetical protein UFVDC4_00038 [Staphylococcus phage vB_SauM-UFV_DC4]